MDKTIRFRIELDEIEITLEQHKAIHECVVVAREDVPGEKRLVAYVVTRAGALTSISDLQEHLRERLPDYMVPTSYVLLDTLPLTANGKIDALALPPPGEARSELRESDGVPEHSDQLTGGTSGHQAQAARRQFNDFGGAGFRALRDTLRRRVSVRGVPGRGRDRGGCRGALRRCLRSEPRRAGRSRGASSGT